MFGENLNSSKDSAHETAAVTGIDTCQRHSMIKSRGVQETRTSVFTSMKLFRKRPELPVPRIAIRNSRRDLTVQKRPESQSIVTMFVALALATLLVGYHSTFATDNLQVLLEDRDLPFTFIGMVILPLLSNDIGPIKASWHKNMDACIALTVGKCVQIALFITPLIIFIAWAMGVDDMNLVFDGFAVICVSLSALCVRILIPNGRCN
jgi:calcium/proton exchanger cax